jgi:hypothetical protein
MEDSYAAYAAGVREARTQRGHESKRPAVPDTIFHDILGLATGVPMTYYENEGEK